MIYRYWYDNAEKKILKLFEVLNFRIFNEIEMNFKVTY